MHARGTSHAEGTEGTGEISLAELERALRVLELLQKPSASEFWDFEKTIARLRDEIERRRT
jgi:hypothetical protein